MSEKIYVGSGKERQTQYGAELDLQLEIDDLAKYVTDYGYVNKAGKHVVRLKVGKRREVGKFGETHTLEINTWKPDTSAPRTQNGNSYQNRTESAPTPRHEPTKQDSDQSDFPDDIPF